MNKKFCLRTMLVVALMIMLYSCISAFAAEIIRFPLEEGHYAGVLKAGESEQKFLLQTAKPAKVTLKVTSDWQKFSPKYGNDTSDRSGLIYYTTQEGRYMTIKKTYRVEEEMPYEINVVSLEYYNTINEIEPNNTSETAMPIQFGKKIQGLMAQSLDGVIVDFYRFTIDTPAQVEIAVGTYYNNINVGIGGAGDGDGARTIFEQEAYKKGTKKVSVILDAGSYHIRINPKYGDGLYGGRYDLTVRIKKKIQPNVKWLKKPVVSVGCYAPWEYEITPYVTYRYWEELGWEVSEITSSDPSVLTYDDIGLFALKKGTATVSFNIKGKIFKRKYKVRENQFIVKKPKAGKKPGIYQSHNMVKYQDGKIIGKVFITNKTKYTITGFENVTCYIDESGYNAYAGTLIKNMVLEKPIKPKKTGVVSFEIPMNSYQRECVDFCTKKYLAVIDGDIIVEGPGTVKTAHKIPIMRAG